MLFETFHNPMQPPWIQLKLMRPKIPGRRYARRVWLKWNANEQCLERTQLAEELPEIYDWVLDVLEAEAAREKFDATRSLNPPRFVFGRPPPWHAATAASMAFLIAASEVSEFDCCCARPPVLL